MEVVVVDGQGGGIGRSVIEALKKEVSGTFIIAVGTNSTATNKEINTQDKPTNWFCFC